MLDAIFSLNTLFMVLVVIYVIACLGLITIVLLQKGKGAGFAGAFGVGSGADAVFGPRGGKSLPQRITVIMATLFMSLAFIMSLIAGRVYKGAAPVKVGSEVVGSQRLEELGLGAEVGGPVAPLEAEPAATTAPDVALPAPAEGAAPSETPPPSAEAPAPAAESPAEAEPAPGAAAPADTPAPTAPAN
jgi:preprotein translocase subunit SecG